MLSRFFSPRRLNRGSIFLPGCGFRNIPGAISNAAIEQIPIPEGLAGQLSALAAKPDGQSRAGFADLYLRETPEEIAAIRLANQVAKVGLQVFFDNLQPGVKEAEVAAAVESAIYRQIGHGMFHSRGWAMVQSEPNSADVGDLIARPDGARLGM